MKMRQIVRMSMGALVLGVLFFATMLPTFADSPEGKGNGASKRDWIGSVSTGGMPTKGGIVPLASNASISLPSGYGWAQATLGWTALRRDGGADTGLSSGVTNVYTLGTQAAQVYKDGNPQGGAGMTWGSRSGGGSVSSTYSVYGWVYGVTWRVDTNHVITGNGTDWSPSLTISATP